uniref:Cleft lip and palate associated transmembrane protein 1 n=1 Tax=Panagrellus redivivus TaxID=6233 RepID=A0A7E4VGE1_PANRE
MPGAEVAAPAADAVAAGEPNAPQDEGWFGQIKSLAMRMIFIFMISNLFRTFMGGGNQSGGNTGSGVANTAASRLPPCMNLFRPNELYDFYMYIDPSDSKFTNFNKTEALIWTKKNLSYGDWTSGENGDGSYVETFNFPTPEVLLQNSSLYLHVFVTKHGKSPNPKDSNYAKREQSHGAYRLNKYRKKHYKLTSNLLTGETEQSEHDQKKALENIKFEILNYWHPNLTVNFVTDFTAWTRGAVPPPLDKQIRFDPVDNVYYPVVYFNNYWNLYSEYQPINDTVQSLNLTLTFSPISMFKWQLYSSQQQQGEWSKMLNGGGEDDESADQDMLKQALLETNPILLAVTVVVSILHTVLEFLAFKNDIQFWRTRKSLEGLSVRSVLFNIFQSLIVFLYICDNDASWVVRMSVFFGLLIEFWKIPKCMDVKVDWENKIFGTFPRIIVSDKGSYVESETKQYDQMAFKYLGVAAFPLLIGYAVYSIMYVEQRGWYNFILSMLYGFLLTFGFIMMTPQLFINYKLKSVAHLPWRMLSYKFINTFIDDLFAFVIKMPTLYRIGCFRDDIIFLIYIYQRWIYRVDPKRVNEYGTSMETPDGVTEGDGAAAEASTPAIENEANAKHAKSE